MRKSQAFRPAVDGRLEERVVDPVLSAVGLLHVLSALIVWPEATERPDARDVLVAQ